MAKIIGLKAREILDSRGNPTLEVDCLLDDNSLGRAGVPSGASKGRYEALELRDNDKKRFLGKGVERAVRNVMEIIGPKIIGMESSEQEAIDRILCDLDGTENKSNLGANAILGVSIAVCRATAKSQNTPLYRYLTQKMGFSPTLPVPLLNLINGGAHAPNNLDIQEYLIIPLGAPSFKEAIRYGAEVYQSLKELLKEKDLPTTIGDEGGFAPNFSNNEEPLSYLCMAIERAGYELGKEIFLGLDVAASAFCQNGKYELKLTNEVLTTEELVLLYEKWIKNYPIISIEDGLTEDDWHGWQKMNERLGRKIQIIGDDIFVTNIERLKAGIDDKIANAILIKLNQVGTVTETLKCIKLAKTNNFNTIISHRSGETEDSFIADFSVATNAGQIKSGAPARSERTSKYNQLLRIEEETGAQFFGPELARKFLI